jgi:hypothetical protein
MKEVFRVVEKREKRNEKWQRTAWLRHQTSTRSAAIENDLIG